jgi:hypothetical protein
MAERQRAEPDQRRIERLREFQQAIVADLRVQAALATKRKAAD